MANLLEAVDETVSQITTAMKDKISDTLLTRIKICLSEALYNIVLHAQVDDKSKSIKIEFTVNKADVVLEIFDPLGAIAFDITAHAGDLSEIDLMAENGRGLALIMECSDRVTYKPSGDGRNKLVLDFDR